mgnify:CR=1 FL=1
MPWRWVERLSRPVDVASLAAFRVIFGGLLFVAVMRHWAKGGIHDAFVAPRFFFPYPGLDWLKPLPGIGMYVVYAAIGLLALAYAAGAAFRASALALFVLFTYAHLADAANYLNHYHLVSLLLLVTAFLPLNASASVDARLRPSLARATVPAWVLWLVRAQIGAVYFFGGVAKLKADWLLSAMPLKIWLATAGDFPVLGPLLRWPEAPYVMSWLGAAFDLSAPFLLSIRRTRPFAYAVVCFFHLVTARLFQIGMFPWIMMGATLLFFEPSWPRRLSPRLFEATEHDAGADSGRRSRGLALAAAWLAVQLVVPLRHWAYGTDAAGTALLWSEEGYRFSWNVMLMEKTGSAELVARDPKTGAVREIRLRDWLTPFQVKMMSTQPDMIAAFAQHVAREAEERGEPRPEIYADVLVTLNGRAPARLIDPKADLARVDDGPLARRRWVLPPPR